MKESRLFRILYYILEKGKATAQELADRFEVSVRTIYRDIDSISSAGIPIYALQGKGGGIRIAEEFVLSRSLLTKEEKEQILTALQGLENTNTLCENELLTKLSALFKMKNTNWIEVDFSNWKKDLRAEKLFQDLKSAIISRKLVSFSYFSSSEEETVRSAKPARLLFKGQDWYLYAFCLLREDFRYFKLSRIKNLEVLPEGFEEDFEGLILEKEIPAEDLLLLKIKFDRSAAFRVYDELGGEIREDEDGSLHAEIRLPDDGSLYHYIFSFGDSAEVLEPKEVRARIKEMAERILKKYKT